MSFLYILYLDHIQFNYFFMKLIFSLIFIYFYYNFFYAFINICDLNFDQILLVIHYNHHTVVRIL